MKKNIFKNVAMKVVAKTAYAEATKMANTSCPFFSYQSKLPNEVKKLRKF